MKNNYLLLLAFFICLVGCRREDIRTCDVEIEGMTLQNTIQMRKVTDALLAYDGNGITRDAFSWRMAENGNLVLTITYDSMQLAQTNLRMAIAETGAKVVFPPNNKNGVAGYVNEKPASVK